MAVGIPWHIDYIHYTGLPSITLWAWQSRNLNEFLMQHGTLDISHAYFSHSTLNILYDMVAKTRTPPPTGPPREAHSSGPPQEPGPRARWWTRSRRWSSTAPRLRGSRPRPRAASATPGEAASVRRWLWLNDSGLMTPATAQGGQVTFIDKAHLNTTRVDPKRFTWQGNRNIKKRSPGIHRTDVNNA